MKNIVLLLSTLFFVATISSCVNDDRMEECPYGSVQLSYFAEQFNSETQAIRASEATTLREFLFGERIKHMRYYLYKDGSLYEEGIIKNFPNQSTGSYSFVFSGLPYGSYQIVAVSNCTGDALKGDCALADNLVLSYPGCENTEDYFTSTFNFTVDGTSQNTYEVDLLRTHGIVRYNFVNLPDDVANIEVKMENVSSEKWITGDYKKNCQVARKYISAAQLSGISRQVFSGTVDGDYVVGAFPTLDNELSSYYLSLYREGEDEPFLTKLISDEIVLKRNQLIDITATFGDGDVYFDIKLDAEWDGVVPGGETEV